MSEPISVRVPTRPEVVAALGKLVERGFTNPDDLPLDDAEVQAAHRLEYAWADEAERQAKASPSIEALLRYYPDRSVLYIDAGFSDPVYLKEVANDWLSQDKESAELAGLTEPAADIQTKIYEINARLGL